MKSPHFVFPGTLVVGGGPAGLSAALWLQQRGQRVELWERDTHQRHRPLPAIMGPLALELLADLGVDAGSLGAPLIDRLRLVDDRRAIEASLGFTCRAVSQHRLEQQLWTKAAEAGASLCRGMEAHGFEPLGTKQGVVLGTHRRTQPSALLLATGGEGVPDLLAPAAHTPHPISHTVLRLLPDQRQALSGCLEWVMTRAGLAILHPLERNSAGLTLIGRPRKPHYSPINAGRFFTELPRVSEWLATRLAGAVQLLDHPISGTKAHVPGFTPLPDRTMSWAVAGNDAVRMPWTSIEDLSATMLSARMASRSLLTGEDIHLAARKLKKRLATSMRYNRLIQLIVENALEKAMWPQFLGNAAAGFIGRMMRLR